MTEICLPTTTSVKKLRLLFDVRCLVKTFVLTFGEFYSGITYFKIIYVIHILIVGLEIKLKLQAVKIALQVMPILELAHWICLICPTWLCQRNLSTGIK